MGAGKGTKMKDTPFIDKVDKLMCLYKAGQLGGEKMPEDENPGLEKGSNDNYLYFTLPMALNYQRNSYKLWESACRTYLDPDTSEVFSPGRVLKLSNEELVHKLTKYKLALQPNKQPLIWRRLSATICEKFNGDLRNLFREQHSSVSCIKGYILSNKPDYPYLGGNKILNYWLYVMSQYTDVSFRDKEALTVAPDTHIIQASEYLGLISAVERTQANVQELVAKRWEEVLKVTPYTPIDLHTPLWLWSRGKFKVSIPAAIRSTFL